MFHTLSPARDTDGRQGVTTARHAQRVGSARQRTLDQKSEFVRIQQRRPRCRAQRQQQQQHARLGNRRGSGSGGGRGSGGGVLYARGREGGKAWGRAPVVPDQSYCVQLGRLVQAARQPSSVAKRPSRGMPTLCRPCATPYLGWGHRGHTRGRQTRGMRETRDTTRGTITARHELVASSAHKALACAQALSARVAGQRHACVAN